MTDDQQTRGTRSLARRIGHVLLGVATLVVITVASIAFGLRITPLQPVSALGQTVGVGSTSPTASLRGPGEVDLFGQPLPTQARFLGPVRPRLVLTEITLNQQVAGLFAPDTQPGSAAALGEQLANGWKRYFAWEITFVAVGALLLLGMIAGWRRHLWSWKKTLVTVLGGLLVVEAINVGLIMLTATTASSVLHDVHSLGELVGRSADAYGVLLGRVNRWNVRNLACSGATIRNGLLGPQSAGGGSVPPQLAVAKRAVNASAVVIGVGANDLNWGPMIRLCAVSVTCDDRASTVFFQRQLSAFARDYYELLRQVSGLPDDPKVVINLYYAPFALNADCLTGLTPAKITVLLDRLDALNAVLADGAKTFGYLSVKPDFTGHGLCTEQPYVQGLRDAAPFHPSGTGQLVIALADERALLGAP